MTEIAPRPIRVLLVEDSAAQRELLVGLLIQDGRFAVAGVADNGLAAVEAAERLRPDVIAMDIHLPVMDGYEATRQIMRSCPTPVVLISSEAGDEARRSLQAIEVGALSVVRKPLSPKAPEQERIAFLTTLRLMAGVRVVTRFSRRGSPEPIARPAASQAIRPLPAQPKILAVAASTGGPAALRALLGGLGAGFPLPILIAQHITQGFVGALADWLNASVAMPVSIARAGERLDPGRAYLAADSCHLLVQPGGIAAVRAPAPSDRFCPSADVLFSSIAAVYGSQAIGVILTGMGDDGVLGLRALRGCGGRTLAQDEATSVVYGMPKAAVQAGAVDHIVALPDLAGAVLELVAPSKSSEE